MDSDSEIIKKSYKMKTRFLAILIFTVNISFAQNSNLLIKKSLSLLQNNEISCFDKTYQRIWVEYLKENIPYYQNALKEVKKKQYNLALQNIDSLISEGYFLDNILKDKDFSKLYYQKGWQKFKKRIDSIKLNYNNEVRRELITVRDKDQSIRLILLESRKSNDNALIKKVHDRMKIIDTQSAIIVGKIIDKYGWLGSDKIGSEANQTLFLGIQHIDDLVVQNKYLPILKDAVKKGNAEPWHFAFLTDRILMNQGKKQIYGTQTIISKKPEDSYVVPLQDPDKVDELRKGIGLEPLNDYLQEEGLSWNLEEYKKDLPRIEKLYRERQEKSK